ncbi:uncharacterized protein LOC142175884 [Nicotiana tabacum]|uniref:Uncharacterized protein LOC142175884 n=1 Tax=Nicotiana tabacum TaxID=4097 RepID=A0AC58TP40_TOBAC
MEQYLPKLKTTKVLWKFPEAGWINVNTDRASRGNPGRSAIGFTLRNEEGDVMYASGKEIAEGTNTETEAKAVVEALRYCIENDYILIDLHTDSMIVKKAIEGEWSVPWSIAREVEEIKQPMTRSNITISHTLREGNRLADHLANYALDVGPIECTCVWRFGYTRKEDSER